MSMVPGGMRSLRNWVEGLAPVLTRSSDPAAEPSRDTVVCLRALVTATHARHNLLDDMRLLLASGIVAWSAAGPLTCDDDPLHPVCRLAGAALRPFGELDRLPPEWLPAIEHITTSSFAHLAFYQLLRLGLPASVDSDDARLMRALHRSAAQPGIVRLFADLCSADGSGGALAELLAIRDGQRSPELARIHRQPTPDIPALLRLLVAGSASDRQPAAGRQRVMATDAAWDLFNRHRWQAAPATPGDRPDLQAPPRELLQSWSGIAGRGWGHRDEGPAVPPSGIITDAATWQAVWHAWRGDEPLPPLDWDQVVVLVNTAEGPNLPGLGAVRADGPGHLELDYYHPLVGGPGYGYRLDVLRRAGLQTLNGYILPPTSAP